MEETADGVSGERLPFDFFDFDVFDVFDVETAGVAERDGLSAVAGVGLVEATPPLCVPPPVRVAPGGWVAAAVDPVLPAPTGLA